MVGYRIDDRKFAGLYDGVVDDRDLYSLAAELKDGLALHRYGANGSLFISFCSLSK